MQTGINGGYCRRRFVSASRSFLPPYSPPYIRQMSHLTDKDMAVSRFAHPFHPGKNKVSVNSMVFPYLKPGTICVPIHEVRTFVRKLTTDHKRLFEPQTLIPGYE